MPLLNLFGCIGHIMASGAKLENDPEVDHILNELKLYQVDELSEQLMASSIVAVDNSDTIDNLANVFNQFAHEVVTTSDDIPIYVALIVINAFKNFNVVTSDTNLNYYKDFIINWLVSEIEDGDDYDYDYYNIKTISDVYDCILSVVANVKKELCLEIKDLENNDRTEKASKLSELYTLLELYTNNTENNFTTLNDLTLDNKTLSEFGTNMKKEAVDYIKMIAIRKQQVGALAEYTPNSI